MSGLTIEMVNEMQDEMFKIDGEDKPSTETEPKVEVKTAKVEEPKVDGTETKEEVAVVEKKVEVPDGKAKEDDVDIIRELKEQVRASNAALKQAISDYQKLQKVLIDKGVISDEEVKADAEAAEAAKAAFAERQNKLIEMVTIMELNPNYADVRQVCSQGNLDDVVEAFSRYYVKENGGNVQETVAQVEKEIWAEPNPYKKIYELVKKYHPKYAEPVAPAKPAEDLKKVAAEADKVKEKKVIEATPSAANLGVGGSGAGGGGWTAAKIDALDEDKLNTVPRDIYEKHLLGKLD